MTEQSFCIILHRRPFEGFEVSSSIEVDYSEFETCQVLLDEVCRGAEMVGSFGSPLESVHHLVEEFLLVREAPKLDAYRFDHGLRYHKEGKATASIQPVP